MTTGRNNLPFAHAALFCSIYEAIGRGKHSVVYKGRKKKSIQYYAIKSVEKTQKPRVLQEVSCDLLAHSNKAMHNLEGASLGIYTCRFGPCMLWSTTTS